jgi:hypothetical protein
MSRNRNGRLLRCQLVLRKGNEGREEGDKINPTFVGFEVVALLSPKISIFGM